MEKVEFPGLAGNDAFVRPLNLDDVDSCVRVEASFPEHERCSEAKFRYRLAVSPELCLGLFIQRDGGAELIGHVVATRIGSGRITNGSMDMPDNWNGSKGVVTLNGEVIGNDPAGEGIGIHGLAILEDYQKKGLGRALMSKYVEFAKTIEPKANCLVLIAHDHLLRFYESVGFKNIGPSPCTFAGGGWYDLVLPLH